MLLTFNYSFLFFLIVKFLLIQTTLQLCESWVAYNVYILTWLTFVKLFGNIPFDLSLDLLCMYRAIIKVDILIELNHVVLHILNSIIMGPHVCGHLLLDIINISGVNIPVLIITQSHAKVSLGGRWEQLLRHPFLLV